MSKKHHLKIDEPIVNSKRLIRRDNLFGVGCGIYFIQLKNSKFSNKLNNYLGKIGNLNEYKNRFRREK